MSDFKTILRALDLAATERQGSLKTTLRGLDLGITLNQNFNTIASASGGIPSDAVLYDDDTQVYYDDGNYVAYE